MNIGTCDETFKPLFWLLKTGSFSDNSALWPKTGQTADSRDLVLILREGTVLQLFLPILDVDTVFEPVAQWQNFSGTNFLKLYFEDPKRWTGAFTQLNSLTR